MDSEKYYQHVNDKINKYIEDPYNEVSLSPIASAIYKYRSDISGLNELCTYLTNKVSQKSDEKYN